MYCCRTASASPSFGRMAPPSGSWNWPLAPRRVLEVGVDLPIISLSQGLRWEWRRRAVPEVLRQAPSKLGDAARRPARW